MRRKDEQKLRRAIRSIISESAGEFEKNGLTVRNPFSHQPMYYGGGQQINPNWQNLTSLYDVATHDGSLTPTTAVYNEENENAEPIFQEVLYSEGLNVMIAKPARVMEYGQSSPFAVFGLKRANGLRNHYRMVDGGIPGAGTIAITEDEYDNLKENFLEALPSVNPKYMKNFGMPFPTDFETAYMDQRNKRKYLTNENALRGQGTLSKFIETGETADIKDTEAGGAAETHKRAVQDTIDYEGAMKKSGGIQRENKIRLVVREMIKKTLNEKALSKSQQRLFGMAHAINKGELSLSDVPADVRDSLERIVNDMNADSIKDFAKTSHDDLPERVEEN